MNRLRVTDDMFARIPALLLEGTTTAEIAATYGVTVGTLVVLCSRRAVNSDQSEVLPKADIGSGGGHVGFVPIGDLVTPSDTRTTAPPSRPHPQPRLIGPEWSKTWTTTNEERP